jgi:hypothetical protein
MHFFRQGSVLFCLSNLVLHWKTLTCPVVSYRQKKYLQADKIISWCPHAYITSIASNQTVVIRQKEQNFLAALFQKAPRIFLMKYSMYPADV